MTAHRDLKKLVRDRQHKTGESYTAARAHVMRERAARLGLPPDPSTTGAPTPTHVEAVVLKVNRLSTRVRLLGTAQELTVRVSAVDRLVPGHVATLALARRWSLGGAEFATGKVERTRLDVARLGLEPLPLRGGEPYDLAAASEPFEDADPYAPLWRVFTQAPRPAFQLDPIAWGALPGLDPEDNPVCDAAELAEIGEYDRARTLLMTALAIDVRCLDAHAHLGNLEFQRNPARADLHYQVGIAIGELSVPRDFDALLLWGPIYNRPFLRCLHGHALCLWRLGKLAAAQQVFARILSLNPPDNQGVRFLLEDVRLGRSWAKACGGADGMATGAEGDPHDLN